MHKLHLIELSSKQGEYENVFVFSLLFLDKSREKACLANRAGSGKSGYEVVKTGTKIKKMALLP